MANFCVLGFCLKFSVILLATVTSHVSTFLSFCACLFLVFTFASYNNVIKITRVQL